ncbi:MAG TPA: prepilin-type N-terminal cleavage/methylation domain-containing protein [Pyrinomonadaceae bacterium]|nr:prepilin-type N-terminal cleavage/methylation domain-containing protein [Pyrinomonadaceae bacterium]
MRERDNSRPRRERGFSLVELLIVVAMISVVAAFAVMQISAAQRAMRLTNSAREFMAWLEKARVDSVRRHPMSKNEMAMVKITAANAYVVKIDQNGDGALDPDLTITIPASYGTSFSGVAVPQEIYFNWRGRPVSDTGASLSLAFTLQSTTGGTAPVPINLTSAGDASLDDAIDPGTVTVGPNANPTSNVRSSTTFK